LHDACASCCSSPAAKLGTNKCQDPCSPGWGRAALARVQESAPHKHNPRISQQVFEWRPLDPLRQFIIATHGRVAPQRVALWHPRLLQNHAIRIARLGCDKGTSGQLSPTGVAVFVVLRPRQENTRTIRLQSRFWKPICSEWIFKSVRLPISPPGRPESL
jgi:hypothetical protein